MKKTKVYLTFSSESRAKFFEKEIIINTESFIGGPLFGISLTQFKSYVDYILAANEKHNSELKKEKRYWLFSYSDYEACGGMDDFRGKFESIEDLKKSSELKKCRSQDENISIWDMKEFEEVKEVTL